eukprot:gi/632970930/ref/XP_007901921.1/ PREDICTED: YEATS domain-containing protein 4 isoform X1 [Callorhinchus milii]
MVSLLVVGLGLVSLWIISGFARLLQVCCCFAGISSAIPRLSWSQCRSVTYIISGINRSQVCANGNQALMTEARALFLSLVSWDLWKISTLGLMEDKGVTIVKPIVYGNVARYFGKKREEDGHTHQWTVYVKPYRNEDMSAYVKKIQFKLHESYGNPLRVVTKPPYEITETGWGEFEIIIKIFFIDPNERPVTLYHLLKLFQSDSNVMLGKKTVVSEFYDEMIFQDPTAMMQQLLTTSRQLTLGAYKHETEFAELEVKTREKLEAAKKKTSFEIAEFKERLKASREAINYLKSEIKKIEEDDQGKET